MTNNKSLQIYVFSLVLAIGINSLYAATYYVERQLPTCSDSNPGTESEPWKSKAHSFPHRTSPKRRSSGGPTRSRGRPSSLSFPRKKQRPPMKRSFAGSNNKIVWEIKLHGDIQRWPDVDDSFPLVVLPHQIEGN